MKKVYKMNIAGLDRELPFCPINENLDIAAFIMFGDVELTIAVSRELLKKCPDFDVILTAEAKGIPLCYEMARQSNKKYLVARKSAKIYTINPIKVPVNSITTQVPQTLYLGELDVEQIKNKNVLIIDDVISAGSSLKALEDLVTKAQGKTVAKACVLAEGAAMERKDIISLGFLPLFFK